MDTLDTLNTLLVEAAGQPWVPLALLLFCIVDGFFPPVPSESLVIGLAAVSAATGQPHLALVFLAGAVGAATGDLIAYRIGRTLGSRALTRLRRGPSARLVDRTVGTLERRSALFLITGRFVPVARVVINLTAGASRMPMRRYVPLCLAAAVVWAGFGVGVGVLGGAWMHENPVVGLLLAIGLGLVLGALVDRLVQRLALAPGGGAASAAQRGPTTAGPPQRPAGSRR